MHNWYLLLLILHSLPQPNFSQHILIDGEGCCTLPSLTKERFSSHGQHRFDKTTPETEDLNIQKENRLKHRHYVLAPGYSVRNRREERYTSDALSRSFDNRKLYRLSDYISSSVLKLPLENIEDRNALLMETILPSRLAHKGHREGKDFRNRPYSYLNSQNEHVKTKSFAKTYNTDRNSGWRSVWPPQRNSKASYIAATMSRDTGIESAKLFRNRLSSLDRTTVFENDKNKVTDRNIIGEQNRVNGFSKKYTDVRRVQDKHIIHSKAELFLPLEQILTNIQIDSDREGQNINMNHKRDAKKNNENRERKTVEITRQLSETMDFYKPVERFSRNTRDFRYIKNSERYSKDSLRDKSLVFEREVGYENNRESIDREVNLNRQEKNGNTRKDRNNNDRDLKGSQTKTISFMHNVRKVNAERDPDVKQIARKIDVRYESNYIKKFKMPSWYRDARQENSRIFKERDLAGYRTTRNENERNGLNNDERHSRGTQYRTISLKSEVRKDDTERVLDEQRDPIRRQRNINVRLESINMRDRDVQYNDGRKKNAITMKERDYIQYREEQYFNARNDPTASRNNERHLRDTRVSKDNVERAIDKRTALNRNERNINVRLPPTDIRNFERRFRDSEVRYNDVRKETARSIEERDFTLNHDERNFIARIDPTDKQNNERYLRDTRAYKDTRVRKDNMERDLNIRADLNRNERNINVRLERNNIGTFERQSRETKERYNDGRKENSRTSNERVFIQHREERNFNAWNDPTVPQNNERHSRDTHVRKDNVERAIDKRTALNRNKRNINVRLPPTNIRNFERRFRDSEARYNDVRKETARSIEERDLTLNHDERNFIARIDPTDQQNNERYLRDTRAYKDTRVRKDNMERDLNIRADLNRNERNINVRLERNNIGTFERQSREIKERYNDGRKENSRTSNERVFIQHREERNFNAWNDPTVPQNNERHSRDTHVRKDNVERAIDKRTALNRNERNINVRLPPTNIRNFERRFRDSEVRYNDVRKETARSIKARDVIQNHKQGNCEETNDFANILCITYNERHSRDFRRYKRNMERLTDIRTALNRKERNIYARLEPNNKKAFEGQPRDNDLRYNDVRQRNTKKNQERDLTQYRQERNRNARYEPSDIRTYEEHSRHTIDKTASLKRNVRKDNTERVSDSETSSIRSERNINLRLEPTIIKNFEGQFQDNVVRYNKILKETLSTIKERNSFQNREERNYIANNNPTDIRNIERHSRDTGQRKICLKRDVQKASMERLLDRQIVLRRNERNINGRLALTNHRNYIKKSRDDEIWYNEIHQENAKRIKETDRTQYHEERNLNSRNYLSDIRTHERHSGDIRDRKTYLKRDIRKDNLERVMDRHTTPIRNVRNINARLQPNNIRNFERKIWDTEARSNEIQENVRKTKERDFTRYLEERNLNPRNEVTDKTTFNRHSRVIQDKTTFSNLFVRKDTMERELSLNRYEQNINVRLESTTASNSERHSQGEMVNKESRRANTRTINEKHLMLYRKERNAITRNTSRNGRMYVRQSEDIRDGKVSLNNIEDILRQVLSLERGATQENMRRVFEIRIARNHNVRNDESKKLSGNSFSKSIQTGRSKNINRHRGDRENEYHEHLGNKVLVATTDSLATPSTYWHYLFYVLQGIYMIGIFMQEQSKPSFTGCFNPSRLLKMD